MRLAIKVDVDTYRGTREGVPALRRLFLKHKIPATFLFSLGPDNTGKALKRIFRKGFLKKCLRSNVAGNYGLKTLMYGTILKAPLIGKLCADIMYDCKKDGFECGIHCWNHFKWQDYINSMSAEEIDSEFTLAYNEFKRIFGENAMCCGAAGWQISPDALAVQDSKKMLYASDTRNGTPFFPIMCGRKFKTLQIPTTLPTLDEVLGIINIDAATANHIEDMKKVDYSVMTVHAELEGMAYLDWFDSFLSEVKSQGCEIFSLSTYAKDLLQAPEKIEVAEIKMSPFKGRSGLLAQRV